VEIEQASAQAAQVEARAAAHGESVRRIRSEVSRVEAILANLAAATAEISGAHDSTEARIAALRRSAAELGDELTRLHGDQAQAEQALAHHIRRASRATSSRSSNCSRNRCTIANARKPPTCTGNPCWKRSRSLEETRAERAGANRRLRRQQHEATAQAGARDALAGGRARRASVEQILNDRSYTADAVQKLFASNQGGEESPASAPSACLPITPKSANNTRAPSSNFCATSWNTSWSKRLTWPARASPCCATKSADAPHFSSIRCAS
jgi:DNA repair exonuclease SbcCD ATPase subunit